MLIEIDSLREVLFDIQNTLDSPTMNLISVFDRLGIQMATLAYMQEQTSWMVCDLVKEFKVNEFGSYFFIDCPDGESPRRETEWQGMGLSKITAQNDALSHMMGILMQQNCDILKVFLAERSGTFQFTDYDTDVRRSFYLPTLSINFVATIATPTGSDPALSDVVPPVLLAVCSDVKHGVCPLPKDVSPRVVRAFLASGNH